MNLILGTANFGNNYGKRLERDECFKILDRAKELGVWAVDTAQSYGDSAKIIQEWNGGLRIFSKYKGDEEYPKYADHVLLHDENCIDNISDGFLYYHKSTEMGDGISLYNYKRFKYMKRIYGPFLRWVQAPFSPLNLEFIDIADELQFIARSIFCGGQLQRSNKEDIAKLVFGFLKSHEVKNAVFGVESIEELELIVKVSNG